MEVGVRELKNNLGPLPRSGRRGHRDRPWTRSRQDHSYRCRTHTDRLIAQGNVTPGVSTKRPALKSRVRAKEPVSSLVAGVRLVYPEDRAAPAVASRSGRISRSALRGAVQGLEHLSQLMDMVEVSDGIGRRAGALAESHFLQGYDVAHLASAETLIDEAVVLVAGDGRGAERPRPLGPPVAVFALLGAKEARIRGIP